MNIELKPVESFVSVCAHAKSRSICGARFAILPRGKLHPTSIAWDEASEFPLDVVKKLGAMGLLGVIFPPEYGGAGLGYVDYVLAIEELSAVDGSIGITVAAHNSLGTNHIFLAGNEEQKKKYVPRLATGEWLAAWGLTEPGAGSDASNARTDRGEEGRPLCAERQQDLHHQWPLCRCRRGDRGDRQKQGHAWAVGLCGGERNARDSAPARKRTSWACGPAIPAS